MPVTMRRLSLRLAPDHWIFDIAPGERAAVVRQALDLSAMMDLIEKRFDRLEEMLQGVQMTQAPVMPDVSDAPGTGIVNDILAAIDEL